MARSVRPRLTTPTVIAEWNEVGRIGGRRIEAPSIVEAVDKFIADSRVRNLGWETNRKYENLLRKHLLSWCDGKGYRQLHQLRVSDLRDFRGTWEDGPNYPLKNLERLRAFFRFCERSDRVRKHPAVFSKAPKFGLKPTLPFTVDEMARIIESCDGDPGNGARLKAFVLVMRYSGLRIADTIQLRLEQVRGGCIRLYTTKTGQHVNVPVPVMVTHALGCLGTPERYSWTGHNLRSAVANWSRPLARLFKLADVHGEHSQRFRDTAACGWLVGGLSVEEVAALLGNSPNVVISTTRRGLRSASECSRSRCELFGD